MKIKNLCSQNIDYYFKKKGYTGELKMPRKVYMDDSHSISINLKPTFEISPNDDIPLFILNSMSCEPIVMQIPMNSSSEQFIEIELLASGFTIDGEKKQRQSLTSQTLSYYWNCYFPNSADHTLSLILRLVSTSGTIPIGDIQHTIKVVKLDHLTQRQIRLMALLASIISGGFAIAEILHRLGVW